MRSLYAFVVALGRRIRVILYKNPRPMSPMDSSSPNASDDEFFALVYDELRNLAHAKMSKEYVYSTLQGTALVHEAWMKLGGEKQPHWQNRAHFFSAAAEAMRRILIDRARKRKSKRHGGEMNRVAEEKLDVLSDTIDTDDELLAINEALEKFAEDNPEKAELVKLRYFSGLSFAEVAQAMNISTATANRWWAYARSWLYHEISSSS